MQLEALPQSARKRPCGIKKIFWPNMSLTALILALILGGLIMFLCGYNPF